MWGRAKRSGEGIVWGTSRPKLLMDSNMFSIILRFSDVSRSNLKGGRGRKRTFQKDDRFPAQRLLCSFGAFCIWSRHFSKPRSHHVITSHDVFIPHGLKRGTSDVSNPFDCVILNFACFLHLICQWLGGDVYKILENPPNHWQSRCTEHACQMIRPSKN